MYPFFIKRVKIISSFHKNVKISSFFNDIKGTSKNIKYIRQNIKMLNLNPDTFFIKKVKKH